MENNWYISELKFISPRFPTIKSDIDLRIEKAEKYISYLVAEIELLKQKLQKLEGK